MTERHELDSPEWISRAIFSLFVGLIVACVTMRAGEWQHPSRPIVAALDDAEEHIDDAPYLAYVWNPDSAPELTRLVSFCCNSALSDLRNPSVMRPAILDGGHLLRLDLRALGDVPRIRKLLAEFVSDPRLYELAPRRGATAVASSPPSPVAEFTTTEADLRSGNDLVAKIPAGTKITSGKRETRGGVEWVQVTHAGTSGWIKADQITNAQGSTVRTATTVFGSHVGPEAVGAGLALQTITRAEVPIVEANEFVRRLMTDLGDGLYAKALGLPADYDEFLKLVGADRKATAAAEAERRAAMFFSQVTRSQRSISFLPIVGAPVDSPRVHSITEDIGKEDVAVDQQPLRNLLGSKFRAGEAMTTALNGRIVWSLWAFDAAGKGTLQKSVPDDIASNSRITPEDRRLQSQLDCLECHTGKTGTVNHDGWRPWDNDARSLIDAVYADKKLSAADFELVRKLRARYDWEPGTSVRSWRDSFAAFVAASDPLPANAEGAKQTPSEFGDAMRAWRGDYLENPVTSQRAANELGLKAATEAEAIKLLTAKIEDRDDGVEDPVLIRLRLPGAKITRTDWNQVWPEFVRRLHVEADVEEAAK